MQHVWAVVLEPVLLDGRRYETKTKHLASIMKMAVASSVGQGAGEGAAGEKPFPFESSHDQDFKIEAMAVEFLHLPSVVASAR